MQKEQSPINQEKKANGFFRRIYESIKNRFQGNKEIEEAASTVPGEIRIVNSTENKCKVTGLSYVNDKFRVDHLNLLDRLVIKEKNGLLVFEIDLRNLKKLNDIFGHDGANMVINHFVQQMYAILASYDLAENNAHFVLYRPQSGGDEFTLSITGPDEILKKIKAEFPERIRHMEYEGISEVIGAECGSALFTHAEQQTFAQGALSEDNGINLALEQKVKELENNLALEDKDVKNLYGLGRFDKLSYLYQLLQLVCLKQLSDQKVQEILKELVKADSDVAKLLQPAAETVTTSNRDAISDNGLIDFSVVVEDLIAQSVEMLSHPISKIDNLVAALEDQPFDRTTKGLSKESHHKISAAFRTIHQSLAENFGSRRMTTAGQTCFGYITRRCERVETRIDDSNRLSLRDLVFLGLLSQGTLAKLQEYVLELTNAIGKDALGKHSGADTLVKYAFGA